jgi:hypothetical protein
MTKWRFYLDFEKEEAWLNEMAAKGHAFENFAFFRYTFSDSKPDEYRYQIELLDGGPLSSKDDDYFDFLRESGIEPVTRWGRWLYLRKKTTDGPFELYTDIDSKIGQYKRIAQLFLLFTLIEFMFGILQLSRIPGYLNGTNEGSLWIPIVFGCLLLGLGSLFFKAWLSMNTKIKRLRKEKDLHA